VKTSTPYLTSTILVIDDEPQIRRVVKNALEREGTSVIEASSGEEGIDKAAAGRPALIILDLGLPDRDGMQVCRDLRAFTTAPIIVLSARHGDPDKVGLLDAGADDYLTKPFRMEELVARARALIRRSAGHATAVIEAGDLTLDTRQMRVLCGGVNVPVSPLEYRLIAYLMHHRGRVVSAGEIIEHLYGDEDSRESNALEALVMRLRKKLGSSAIETRRGFGYLIADDGS
jgi:two-component system OmpR family response regulator